MSTAAQLSDLLGDSNANDDAIDSMRLTADAMGPAIQAAMGDVPIDDIDSAELTVIRIVVDNSSSIKSAGNDQAVRDGVNSIFDALAGSKQAGGVLISVSYLNDDDTVTDGVLFGFRPLEGVIRLTDVNYRPRGGTPLYDAAAAALTSVAAIIAKYEADGVSVRAVTAIVTDGANVGSRVHFHPDPVKQIVNGLLRTEQHIVIGLGISDGYTDFNQVFQSMGIQPAWCLVAGSDASSIRAAFDVVSQSAVRASQAAGASFSEVALGGFGS